MAGVERQVSVFADRPYTRSMSVGIAYLPKGPERVFIVGATPWAWWAAMRPLFVTIAVVATLVLAGIAVRGRDGARRP